MTNQPRAVLLYPPITDPTSGYHSLSYIDSYAVAQGHRPTDLIDVNIEAFHYSYSPKGLAWLETELNRPRTSDEYGLCLPQDEVIAANLLRAGDPDPDSVRDAVDLLRDPVRFYDYRAYQNAV